MADQPIALSVLDRLIDADLDDRGFRLRGREQALVSQRAAVVRDLEWLLNTRRIPDEAPDDFPEVQSSVYHYGIRDVTSLSGESAAVKRLLARDIREAIRIFEPRLSQVRIVWSDEDDGEDGAKYRLRFRIDALLDVDPETERVSFDAVLDSVQGDFAVHGSGHA